MPLGTAACACPCRSWPDAARPSHCRFLAEAFASHVEAAHALQHVSTEAIALPRHHTEVAVQLPHVAADLAPPSSSTPPSTWGAEEPPLELLCLAAAPGAAAGKEAVWLLREGIVNGERRPGRKGAGSGGLERSRVPRA